MPYLDSRLESKNFIDSLNQIGIDTVLLYHKKHGNFREYFIFWLNKAELQVRKVNSTGIFEIGDWNFNGFYRDKNIFTFYTVNKDKIDSDKIEEVNWSHYPYVDISVTIAKTNKQYHLPFGINSPSDNTTYHYARLIESTIYNLENSSYWKQAEKKLKYFPKNYDPTKEKWENWKREKINSGEIWDDYYH
jgi:5-hydroxyisourate hydrolase-like protein (transthyretin family)